MPLETAGLGGAERRPRRRRVLRWIGYLLAGLAGLVVLLAIVGAIYQSVESSNDLRAHSPPGPSCRGKRFTRCIFIVWAMEAPL